MPRVARKLGVEQALLEYALVLREAGVNHVAFNLKYGRRSARDVLEEIGREVLPRVE